MSKIQFAPGTRETLKHSNTTKITTDNPPQYVVLAHAEYTSRPFKVYNNIPTSLMNMGYLPSIMLRDFTLKPITLVEEPEWWKGISTDALQHSSNIIAEGKNPLILSYAAALLLYARQINSKRSKALPASKKKSIQGQLATYLEGRPEYQDIYELLLASYEASSQADIHLSDSQARLLLKIIGVVIKDGDESGLKPDSYALPPRGAPLIDMSQYEFPLDENGDPILPPEYANIEPAYGPLPSDLPSILPPDSIYHGQSKAEALRLNRTRRRKV